MKRFRFHGRRSARARSVVSFTQPESLESRELMSFSAHVNFQTPTAYTPSGYLADTGKTYGSRNGLTYGWNADNSANTRNRDSSLSKDQRYDTFTHMQRSGSYSWNMAVPNGTYSVHIVSGDAGYYDSAFRIAAEGKTVVNGNPTSSNRWVEGTATVTVSDGKLTVTNASGAVNNKIDFIDISQSSTSTSSSSTSSSTTLKIPPASPSNLAVSSASSTSLKLTWSDNSTREDGYKIERSTDGKTWSQITSVGTSTTSYTNTGLSSGKKYYYRVRAYNTYGNSSYTNTASATTGSSTSTSSGSTSSPSGTTTSGYFDGVFVGGDDPNKIIPILRDLGAKAVRLWGSFSDWNSRSETSTMQRAIAYHNAGFKVDLLLQNPSSVPSYSQAKAYYAWALTVPGLKSAVDFWEIQNEPNISSYWKGTLSQYVNNVLKAAWDTIHAAGEKVVGAGVTASRSANQALKDAGYLHYVDYANVHPYDSGASGQRQTITDIKAMFAGKPLVITEWGLQTSGTTSWADALDTNHPFVEANTSAAWYFPLVQTSTPAGGEGLLTSSLAKHQPFYDTFKSWHT